MDLKAFPRFASLADALADRVEAELGEEIASAGRASLIVPGGTTPGPFFDILCRRALAWDKVTVTLTDERWVPVSSERSNERLVRARLLAHEADQAAFVPLKSDAASAREAVPEIEARIARISRPFVAVAGMGDDGHTFSWIPKAGGLAAALDPEGARVCAIVPPHSSNLGERISLTLRAALEARMIFVLARGEEKRRAFEAALAGKDVAEMPIRALMQQTRVPVAFFWTGD